MWKVVALLKNIVDKEGREINSGKFAQLRSFWQTTGGTPDNNPNNNPSGGVKPTPVKSAPIINDNKKVSTTEPTPQPVVQQPRQIPTTPVPTNTTPPPTMSTPPPPGVDATTTATATHPAANLSAPQIATTPSAPLGSNETTPTTTTLNPPTNPNSTTTSSPLATTTPPALGIYVTTPTPRSDSSKNKNKQKGKEKNKKYPESVSLPYYGADDKSAEEAINKIRFYAGM